MKAKVIFINQYNLNSKGASRSRRKGTNDGYGGYEDTNQTRHQNEQNSRKHSRERNLQSEAPVDTKEIESLEKKLTALQVQRDNVRTLSSIILMLFS